MIKMHAIIRDQNSNRRHLQLDSNTKIYNVTSLYEQTFGADKQINVLNASLYDENINYVSAHNKIVYTTPESKELVETLRNKHLEYCLEHASDGAPEKTSKNSIYSKNFAVTLSEFKLSTKSRKDKKIYYSANMEKLEYKITFNIITAINMSWSETKDGPILKALKALPEIEIGDAKCGYLCFANIVRKYTGYLDDHVLPSDIISDNPYENPSEAIAHKQLLDISNKEADKFIANKFLKHVAKYHHEMIERLMYLFTYGPQNNRTKEFINDFFECENIDELQQKLSEENDEVAQKTSDKILLDTEEGRLAKFLQDKLSKGYDFSLKRPGRHILTISIENPPSSNNPPENWSKLAKKALIAMSENDKYQITFDKAKNELSLSAEHTETIDKLGEHFKQIFGEPMAKAPQVFFKWPKKTDVASQEAQEEDQKRNTFRCAMQ